MTAPTASLRSFMTELIDYDCLERPTSLSPQAAIADYIAFSQTAEAWMLSHIVIPIGRLQELTAEHLESDDFLYFSIIGRGAADGDTWLNNLKEDIATMERFLDQHGRNVIIDMLELTLPLDILHDGNVDELKILLDQAYDLLDQIPYYEVPFTEGWEEMVKTAMTAIRMHYGVAGFKLRCGGPTAEAYPTIEQIAYVLKLCLDNGIALKCAAGLDQPIRRYNDALQIKTHGFFNVFGAGLLAEHHDLSLKDIETIVADENPHHFIFDDDNFQWGHWHIPIEALETVREDSLISFGSCHIDQLRHQLHQLNLL